MKAAQINNYGGKAVVKTVDDTVKPRARTGQVLVEVHAASVNPFDWKVRQGMAKLPEGVSFPATLGGDCAGVVAELGEGVSGFNVGDEVYGQANALSGQGSWAEFTPVKALSLAAKPESIDFISAAALPLTCVSAYQGLVDHADLKSGQKVLIHGGAGGIGSCAIPLAKHLGAYVATTAGAEHADYVKKLGADEVIDYKKQDFTMVIKDYDAVFDLVGGDSYVKSYQVLKPDGVIVSMLEAPDEALVKQFNVRAIHQSTKVTSERLNKLTELIDKGVIKANVSKTFVLDQAAEALEELKTGGHQGKIVIKVR